MVMQSIFPQRPTIQANYDWIDLAAATGFIVFDGFNAKTSAGNNYVLAPANTARAAVGEANIGEGRSVVWTTFTAAPQACDIDFDLSPFQLPRTIEGTGFVRIPLALAGVANANVYVIAKLRKYSAGESTIVTVQSPTDVVFEANADYSWALPLVIPRTHFKKGDILRLTIEIYCDNDDAITLAHNPNDTALSDPGDGIVAGGTRLTLTVPFKLDFM